MVFLDLPLRSPSSIGLSGASSSSGLSEEEVVSSLAAAPTGFCSSFGATAASFTFAANIFILPAGSGTLASLIVGLSAALSLGAIVLAKLTNGLLPYILAIVLRISLWYAALSLNPQFWVSGYAYPNTADFFTPSDVQNSFPESSQNGLSGVRASSNVPERTVKLLKGAGRALMNSSGLRSCQMAHRRSTLQWCSQKIGSMAETSNEDIWPPLPPVRPWMSSCTLSRLVRGRVLLPRRQVLLEKSSKSVYERRRSETSWRREADSLSSSCSMMAFCETPRESGWRRVRGRFSHYARVRYLTKTGGWLVEGRNVRPA